MSDEPVAVLHLWRVPRRGVPAALVRMAADRPALGGVPGLRFAKLLGTATGRTFTPGDVDPRRWALLTVWDDGAAAATFDNGHPVDRWRRLADEEWSVRLRPLAARGRWAGREPFGRPGRPSGEARWDGAVAAVTRARLAPRKAVTFWRAVPPVAAELHAAPGLRLALGIGEAPIGFQGTFSLWRSTAALNSFVHGHPAHADAVRRTPVEGWYAEELFARFAVVDVAGRPEWAGSGT